MLRKVTVCRINTITAGTDALIDFLGSPPPELFAADSPNIDTPITPKSQRRDFGEFAKNNVFSSFNNDSSRSTSEMPARSDSGLGASDIEDDKVATDEAVEDDLLQAMTQPEIDHLYNDEYEMKEPPVPAYRGPAFGRIRRKPTPSIQQLPVPLFAPRKANGTKLDLARLPVQIIEAIASQVESVVDLISCMLVNKHWTSGSSRALYRNPSVYNLEKFHMLLAVLLDPVSSLPYAGFVTHFHIKPALSDFLFMGDVDVALQLFPQLRSFSMALCPTASNVLVQSLSDHSRHLRNISLSNTNITDAFIPDLIRACPKLEVVNFSHTSVTMTVLKMLVDKCERIWKIDLENCGSSSKPVLLDPNSMITRSLKHLNLKNSGIHDILFRYICVRCPELEVVSIEGCAAITDDGLMKLAFSCADIKKVDCSFCPQISDLTLRALGTHSRKLESAVFSGCDLISPEGVVFFAGTCQNLNELVMHGCSRILPSYVRDYSLRHYELDCAVRGSAIKWLAGHKAVQVLEARVKTMITQSDQMIQTDPEITQPTQVIDNTKSDSESQRELPRDATEVLMKLAEAIAEGKWVPPGGNWSNASLKQAPANVNNISVKSEASDSWDPSNRKYPLSPGAAEKRWSDTSSSSSISQLPMLATGRKPIGAAATGLPVARSPASRVSSLPGSKLVSPRASRIATTQLILPVSKIAPGTPTRISMLPSAFPSALPSPGLTSPQTPATPGGEQQFKPRKFKKFNDDGFGTLSTRLSGQGVKSAVISTPTVQSPATFTTMPLNSRARPIVAPTMPLNSLKAPMVSTPSLNSLISRASSVHAPVTTKSSSPSTNSLSTQNKAGTLPRSKSSTRVNNAFTPPSVTGDITSGSFNRSKSITRTNSNTSVVQEAWNSKRSSNSSSTSISDDGLLKMKTSLKPPTLAETQQDTWLAGGAGREEDDVERNFGLTSPTSITGGRSSFLPTPRKRDSSIPAFRNRN
ncbi:hypothetical protein HK096_006064 [Nowakowskiella sp. JEL0078]|nr:hypothetical protein HK096_006064 [Nowakowskiella sp. JEL0078]